MGKVDLIKLVKDSLEELRAGVVSKSLYLKFQEPEKNEPIPLPTMAGSVFWLF